MSGRQVRIGTVWDRTVDVLRGRAGILAGIAVLFILLPGIFSNAVSAFGGTMSAMPGMRVAGLVVSITVSLLLLVGLLAITAVSSDPAVDRARGVATGARRLGAALACIVVLLVAVVLTMLPISYLMFSSGATFNPVTGRIQVPAASAGTIALAGLLSIGIGLFFLWLTARLAPIFAVIVNERRGLGAFARSFALTRGATLRLVGVIILYVVVMGVLTIAATSVVGIVARLLLGADANAGVLFAVAVVGTVLTTVTSAVQAVFYTQYYLAATTADGVGQVDRTTFEPA